MRAGDIINGYEILEDFTTAGGGLSKWTFAQRGGREYFIKEFLSPLYPIDGSPGSAETKDRKRKDCVAFEQHHYALIQGIAQRCGTGGNLIAAVDFFRCDSKYYKVTEKVDVTTMPLEDISGLPLPNRIFILRTVAHSLRILHQAEIVHADIKPGNILIKETKVGGYTAKLIDFDSSFFSGNPPLAADEVVGDMAFYSPEMARYILKDAGLQPSDLRTKSDIFALGLVFNLYLTGRMPVFDQEVHRYAYAACEAGQELRAQSDSLPPSLVDTLHGMLLKDSERRLGIEEVYARLKALKVTEPIPPGKLKTRIAAKDEARLEPPPLDFYPGKLKVKMSPGAPPPPPTEKGPAPGVRTSLKGGLLSKREKAD